MTGDYPWDYYNDVTAGQYLDHQERIILDKFFNSHSPRSCLDIACGSGRISLQLMGRGIHVVAADLNLTGLKKLHAKAAKIQNDRIDLLQSDANNLSFKNETFDCILSLQTVGYLRIKHFLSECNRILKNDGWLLFNEANRHSYKSVIHRKLSPDTQFYRRSHSEICSLLNETNFRIERSAGMNWLPQRRDSDNRWTPIASKIESKLKLSAFPSISPWVFYVAQKRGFASEEHRTDRPN